MLTEFIRYLSAERRYSPLTVRNYKHDVEQFLAWLDCDESRFDPRSVTTEQIREWIIFRTEEGKLSAGSMNREVASLRAFFRWLHRTGAVEKDIFRPANGPKAFTIGRDSCFRLLIVHIVAAAEFIIQRRADKMLEG